MAWHLISFAKQLNEAMKVDGQDVWVETDHEWIRVHNEPRRNAYVPEQGTDGPMARELALYRRSECFPVGSGRSRDFARSLGSTTHQVVEDDWQEAQHAQLGEVLWTGLTRFQKVQHTQFGISEPWRSEL